MTETPTLGKRAKNRARVVAIAEQLRLSEHIDRGANTGTEIQARAELAESMASDTYRPSTDAEIISALTAEPTRYADHPCYIVNVNHLLSDLRRRVKIQARGYTRDERADIATDALLLLCRWTHQGEAPSTIYLGPSGKLPMRRDWYDAEQRTVIRDGKSTRPAPNVNADRAMRAAIGQALDKRSSDGESQLRRAAEQRDEMPLEEVSAELTLAQVALRRAEQEQERAPSLPDTDAPELLAQAMGITLTAARALVARGWRIGDKRADVLADQWGVSQERAKSILKEGAREIRKRYPQSSELIEALASAAPELRELMKERAAMALNSLAMTPASGAAHQRQRARALAALYEWRSASGALPMQRRALELAGRRAGWEAEHIGAADYVFRLLSAECARGAMSSALAMRGSHTRTGAPSIGQSVAASAGLPPVAALPSSEYGRAVLYARAARADRANRPTDGAEPIEPIARPARPYGEKLRSAELAQLRTRVSRARAAEQETNATRARMGLEPISTL